MNARKLLCFFVLIVSIASAVSGQKKPIVAKSGFFGTKFYHGETRISKNEMYQLFEDANQSELISLYKHGHNAFHIGEILGGVGGGLLGIQMGLFATNQETSQKVLVAGFVITGLSLTLSIPGARKMSRAINTYNGVSDSSFFIQTKLTSNGLAFVVNF